MGYPVGSRQRKGLKLSPFFGEGEEGMDGAREGKNHGPASLEDKVELEVGSTLQVGCKGSLTRRG